MKVLKSQLPILCLPRVPYCNTITLYRGAPFSVGAWTPPGRPEPGHEQAGDFDGL